MKTIFLHRKRILVIVPLLVIMSILAYYQLFYRSERVNSGVGTLALTFTKHQSIVTAVRFTPNDSLLVTSSVDSTVKIWERASGKVRKTLRQPQGISYMDLSADGRYVATGSYDSCVRIWRVADGSLLHLLKGHQGTVWTVAFSADGKQLASSGDDATIRVWEVETGRLLHALQGHKRIVWSVKFSPDGKQLASGSFDYTLKLWNLADGTLAWNNTGHSETVVDLAFSHDGRLLASTSDDKTVKLWNLADRRLLQTMTVAEHVQAVAFSSDDKRLLTGGRDKPMIGEFLQTIFGDSHFNPGISARLWDVKTGTLLQTFSHHANDVMDVAISHNGHWLASASADKTVDLWQVNK
jgi:WD40 repeat protein